MTGPVIYGKQTSSSGQELNEGNVNVNLNVENGKQCMGAGEATSLVAFRKESSLQKRNGHSSSRKKNSFLTYGVNGCFSSRKRTNWWQRLSGKEESKE
jgi:hypothetical protein